MGRRIRAAFLGLGLAIVTLLAVAAPDASAVTGGGKASTGTYPWIIHFKHMEDHGPFGWVHFEVYSCAGTLISPTKVLTAGHCGHAFQHQKGLQAVQGQTNTSKGGRFYDVASVDVQPSFYPDKETGDFARHDIHWGDLAVVTLKKPILGVPTLPIPSNASQETLSGNGLILGWSTDQQPWSPSPAPLRYSYVPIWSQQTCKSIYGSLVNDGMICAGDAHHDACNGDSGGPLIRNGWLIGVVSGGGDNGCDKPNWPGTYARTLNYAWWIHSKM